MFLSKNKKNNVYPCKPQFFYIKVGFKGSTLYRRVFVMASTDLYNSLGINSTDGKMIFFLFFQKTGLDISFTLSPLDIRDNLHEMSKPVFWEKIRKIF